MINIGENEENTEKNLPFIQNIIEDYSDNSTINKREVTKDKVIMKIKIQKHVKVIFNLNNLKRFDITISDTSNLNSLCSDIINKFMTLYKEFQNLQGLKLSNLAFKKDKISLPTPLNFENFDNLYNGSIILCDIKSKNYWIKTQINIITNSYTYSINLELKLDLDHKIDYLKDLLIKLGLFNWLQKDNHSRNYLINKITYKTNRSNLNLEFEYMDSEINFVDLDTCIILLITFSNVV